MQMYLITMRVFGKWLQFCFERAGG